MPDARTMMQSFSDPTTVLTWGGYSGYTRNDLLQYTFGCLSFRVWLQRPPTWCVLTVTSPRRSTGLDSGQPARHRPVHAQGLLIDSVLGSALLSLRRLRRVGLSHERFLPTRAIGQRALLHLHVDPALSLRAAPCTRLSLSRNAQQLYLDCWVFPFAQPAAALFAEC